MARWPTSSTSRAVTRALGDDVVLLVRGHAFNARSRKRVGALPGAVDVTDYPEVSDLYLAADAAIVDYSSLRFDFGVTGKPMIFHVPDLQRYKDTRGWLFDFEPTAPGPLVDTTERGGRAPGRPRRRAAAPRRGVRTLPGRLPRSRGRARGRAVRGPGVRAAGDA